MSSRKERSNTEAQESSGKSSTDPSLLRDPESEIFLGQGSFAVVKLKLFRGIQVAVKELQPRTLLADVKRRLTP